MTGMTTINISQVAVRISDFCCIPIAPFGSSNAILQPLSNNGIIDGTNHQHLFFII
jgi:hypothetical protein